MHVHRFIIAAPITSPTIATNTNETSDFVKKKGGISSTSSASTSRAVKGSSSAGKESLQCTVYEGYGRLT